MSRLLRSLTAGAILAHALMGCCAHEVHANGHNDCGHRHELTAPTAAEASEHQCSDSEEDEHCEASPILALGHTDCKDEKAPETPHQCLHGSCHWTTCDTTGFQLAFQTVWLSFYECVSCETCVTQSSLVWRQVCLDHRSLGPPVRSHLALNILLI